MPQYSFKATPAEVDEDSSLPSLKGPAAVALNFGGSSFRFSFVLPNGEVHEFCEGNWEGYFAELERRDILATLPLWEVDQPRIDGITPKEWTPSEASQVDEIIKNCSVFAEIAAQMINDAAYKLELSPPDIKRLGITTPGVIDKVLGVILKANNIKLADLDGFDLVKEIHENLIHLDSRWRECTASNILNDAEAGVHGEIAHPDGYLNDTTDAQGVAINGTAFGGQMIIKGIISDKYREFGYVLARDEKRSINEEPRYVFLPLDETLDYYPQHGLRTLGTQIPGMRFLETVAGGRWASVYFLQSLEEEDLLESFLELAPELPRSEIEQILALKRTEELVWDTTPFEGTINHVGMMRVQLGQEKIAGPQSLVTHAREYDLQLAREIGAAFKALRIELFEELDVKADDIRIALVSSVFEGHREDSEWLSIILDSSGLENLEVSKLSQTVREAYPHGANL